jgi:hypothetical protein
MNKPKKEMFRHIKQGKVTNADTTFYLLDVQQGEFVTVTSLCVTNRDGAKTLKVIIGVTSGATLHAYQTIPALAALFTSLTIDQPMFLREGERLTVLLNGSAADAEYTIACSGFINRPSFDDTVE